MDESFFSLSKHENKQIQINLEDQKEMSPILKETNIFGEQSFVAHTKESISPYIERLLNSLDDDESTSLSIERIKENVMNLLRLDSKAPDYTYKVMETADALDAFLDTHQGSYLKSYKKERKTNVLRIKDAIMSILEKQRQEMAKEKKLNENNADNNDVNNPEIEHPTKARLALATSGVNELASNMRKWRARIGKYVLTTPEEVIDQKLAIYEAYMDDILVYRNNTKFKDMPKEYQKVLMDYDNLKLRKDLISWDKSKEGHKEYYKNQNMEIAESISKNLDDKLTEKKTMDKELDKDLTKEQAMGIQDIDRWMIRNFSNGGLANIQYPQEAFVQKILSLSKRERLYLYYMVETGARKTATMADLVQSQEYAPNLSAFKDQMLATKFKAISHITGAYVYWHKLTEAMQRLTGQGDVLESYLKGRNAFLEEESKENKQEKNQDEKQENAPAPRSLEALSKDRLDNLKNYHRGLGVLAKAIKENRPQKEIETIKENVDGAYTALLESDEKVKTLIGSNEYKGDIYFRRNDALSFGSEVTKYSKIEVSNAPAILDDTLGHFWNVRSWNWNTAQKGIEITTGTIGSLNSVLGLVGGIIGLYYTAQSSSGIDLTEQISGLATTITNLSIGIWGAVFKTGKALDTAKNFMEGVNTSTKAIAHTPLQKAGVGMAVVGLSMAAFQGAVAYNHHSNLQDAKTYFKERDSDALLKLKENKGKYSGTPEEIKAQREARFHQNIAKLSEVNIKNKRDSAIFSGVIGAVALASSIMPLLAPLGFVALGTGIALGYANRSVKAIRNHSANTTAFDDYFNVDEIFKEVKLKQQEDGRYPTFKRMSAKTAAKKKAAYDESLRENIRQQLAAKYGFSNVKGARLYIANTYADYIISKIQTKEGENKPSSEDLKGIESLLNSMGLSINSEKHRPTKFQIRAKLCGR